MLQELDAARTHPVTLLSAFAGSGKTTLLSAWATPVSSAAPPAGQDAAEEPVVAWLSLDALDNDLIRLWSLVIAALQTRLPQVGQRAQELLHAPDPPALSTIVSHLLDEIHHAAREIILILDDYHLIADPTSQETMRFLLEQMPVNLHLVLATRTDPPLPLARLRVRGQLIEIRDQELRFTQEEAASFLLESMGLPLQAEEVTTLAERTQGWIAGLHLAALSLHKQSDLGGWIAHFTGSHRYLVDYVQQEILAQVPQELRQFLLHTSILTRMTAALCQTVTGVSTLQRSQELLEEVERANLFVVPLDEQRQWYRQHDLFREALLARVQASQPDVLPQLHQRAARWYETAGELREAVAHALAASDYPYAATVIEQAAPHMWASGEAQMVHTWVLALPDALLRAKARLALEATYRLQDSLHLSGELLHGQAQAQIEQGASNQEIAQTLVIQLSTVKKHVSSLLSKLGATSRTQALAQARARSLL